MAIFVQLPMCGIFMEKRVGIIDCGTNTFNLIVAEINNSVSVLHESKIPVKIGQGMQFSGRFSDEAMARAWDALRIHKCTAETWGCKFIRAFATAGFRNAENGADFASRIHRELEIPVEIIPGSQEAAYICRGILAAGALNNMPRLIMDIGGGSTELVLASEQQMVWGHSFEVGASRILEAFSPSSPVLLSEITAVQQHLEQVFAEADKQLTGQSIEALVGSSGFFDTLADMAHFLIPGKYELGQIIREVALSDYTQVRDYTLQASFEQKMQTPGLPEFRVEMINGSFLLADYVIRKYGIQRIICCKYAMKEGILHSLSIKKP